MQPLHYTTIQNLNHNYQLIIFFQNSTKLFSQVFSYYHFTEQQFQHTIQNLTYNY